MKELTAHDRYQERQRIAEEQHIQRANMKIYCELCKKVQPVQIDNGIDVETKKPYQDIVCAECNLVIASGTDIAPLRQALDLQTTIERGTKAWADVPSASEWVDELRGNDTPHELKECVHEFFTKYLNCVEETDSGRPFNPVTIGCCRALMLEPLNKLLDRMRELSGAKPNPLYKDENT